MRQIVQLDKLIVQQGMRAADIWPFSPGIEGAASADAWRGGRTELQWDLSSAIGYLLVTADGVTARCAAGVDNELRHGELLVTNAGSRGRAAFTLDARDARRARRGKPGVLALHGAITAMPSAGRALAYANTPAWSMAVLRLSEAEYQKIVAIGHLVADCGVSPNVASTGDAASRLCKNLQAALFEMLAAALSARDPLSLPQLTACRDQRISNALLAMAAKPAQPWRIETMARAAAMSRTAFATQFKKVVGQTPLDYLTGLRLQVATTLLESAPTQSIDSIAREVGYADESALRRAHLRTTGAPLNRRGIAAGAL